MYILKGCKLWNIIPRTQDPPQEPIRMLFPEETSLKFCILQFVKNELTLLPTSVDSVLHSMTRPTKITVQYTPITNELLNLVNYSRFSLVLVVIFIMVVYGILD